MESPDCGDAVAPAREMRWPPWFRLERDVTLRVPHGREIDRRVRESTPRAVRVFRVGETVVSWRTATRFPADGHWLEDNSVRVAPSVSGLGNGVLCGEWFGHEGMWADDAWAQGIGESEETDPGA